MTIMTETGLLTSVNGFPSMGQPTSRTLTSPERFSGPKVGREGRSPARKFGVGFRELPAGGVCYKNRWTPHLAHG